MKRKWLVLQAFVFVFFLVIGGNLTFAQSYFIRGDTNFDGSVDISDPIGTLSYLFSGADLVCEDSGDTNDDGSVDISDAVYLLAYLFSNDDAPSEPFNEFEGDPTDDDLTCKPIPVEVTGDITSDLTLTKDRTYKLVSGVFIKDGATLTIKAGTTVLGSKNPISVLVVEPGGKLIAQGTSTQPIIFTSDQPVGSRARGDWGGLVLLGNAQVNTPTGFLEAEGLENVTFGGGETPDNEQDSGVLSYVRVEFGGWELSPNNEINSISLFGVGSGTKLDHIQVKYNLDDGFEWFGGTCSLKHAICTGIGDDSFDYSFGWVGKGQFWVCQQRGDDADRGFEVDNNEETYSNTPLTCPTISNVTLVGDPSEASESDTGLVFRRGAGTKLYNAIVQGFKDAGLDIDDGVTTNNSPDNGNLIVSHCFFAENKEPAETGETEAEEEIAANEFNFSSLELLQRPDMQNTLSETSGLVDPYNLDSPDFRGRNLPAGMDPSTIDSWFEPATFIGAVDPDATAAQDWTREVWTSYRQN